MEGFEKYFRYNFKKDKLYLLKEQCKEEEINYSLVLNAIHYIFLFLFAWDIIRCQQFSFNRINIL